VDIVKTIVMKAKMSNFGVIFNSIIAAFLLGILVGLFGPGFSFAEHMFNQGLRKAVACQPGTYL
jgi:cytochrome bd-type quinol oxidase subunit 2